MSFVITKTVTFDNTETNVTLKFNHWLPKLLKVGGITIGKTSYYPRLPHETALILIAHELVHKYDFFKKTKKIPGGYFIDVVVDILLYIFDWMRVGFKYKKIHEEVWAYDNGEERVLGGTFEGISAPWISERFKKGYKTIII